MLLCLFCLTGCKDKTELKETTIKETESELETTKNIDINIDERFKETKNENGEDIYINLEDISDSKLDEEGNINITNEDIETAKNTGEVQLYNLENKKKALDYKVPKGYELLNLTGNQVYIKHVESGVPYYIEILDGTKEDNIAKMEAEMKAENSYIRDCSFDLSREENLSGFNCILKRKNDFYDYADQYREYTTYCFADCLGSTVQIRVAEDFDYLIPKGVDIEDYEAPTEVKKALENLDYVSPFYEEILTGISYK